jgi:hypothetical protein
VRFVGDTTSTALNTVLVKRLSDVGPIRKKLYDEFVDYESLEKAHSRREEENAEWVELPKNTGVKRAVFEGIARAGGWERKQRSAPAAFATPQLERAVPAVVMQQQQQQAAPAAVVVTPKPVTSGAIVKVEMAKEETWPELLKGQFAVVGGKLVSVLSLRVEENGMALIIMQDDDVDDDEDDLRETEIGSFAE